MYNLCINACLTKKFSSSLFRVILGQNSEINQKVANGNLMVFTETLRHPYECLSPQA